MSERTLRTQSCSAHGHREFTLTFGEPLPVPGIERMLLDYLEGGVAQGLRFEPEETVLLGWAMLRVGARADGTLGLWEMDLGAESGWAERVDRSLMQTWQQKELVRSVGLEELVDFPRQLQLGTVCNKVLERTSYMLSRSAPADEEDSGWFLGCDDLGHDHDRPENVARVQLLSVVDRLPFLAQFLALPATSQVVVLGPGRIRAELWHGERKLQPSPGSYLESLNAREPGPS